MELQIESNVDSLSVRWKDAVAGVFTGRGLLSAMRRIGLQLQKSIIANVSGDSLTVRTGRLRRAIYYRVEADADGRNILVRAGADLGKAAYGRIHNFGGVIRPVHAANLTIPLSPNLTGNGVMRVNAHEFINNPGSIGFTGSFVNRKKTAIMGVRPGGSVEPVFALVKSVTIKPTGYITRSLEDNSGFVQDQLSVVASEIKKGLSGGTTN